MAAVNGGIALHIHRQALCTWLRTRLNLPNSGTRSTLSLLGHYGLGGDALPRLLAGRLQRHDVSSLTDYFDLDRERITFGDGDWDVLLAAAYDGAAITWKQIDREHCQVRTHTHAHGFEELDATTVRCSRPPEGGVVDTATYSKALYVEGLGLSAIAAGLVDHALAIGRRWAARRRQGGDLIENLPAVQQMLAQMSTTAGLATARLSGLGDHLVDSTLDSTAEPAVERAALIKLCAMRSQLHPACCTATDHAIQILGGRGYLRDHPAERLVRDANALRIIGGTPLELELFVAESERLS
ncbi:acyl-CoA dehydrogenase family protein [Nocardia goodfellowii]|uniref:Acyl-CoA dehydrogenase/oxidase C-terminal domain-containing protein n=1 Tax=Nocardia goodfellowii TaxID=882446 RepID=A0ABS4QKD8_9NOCA|nr:acyl-CoA dehydrogenase family protein [Nocardia goodfellowii]MBP2191585.1 hypothetical protein [Nocardia goodfellowii]